MRGNYNKIWPLGRLLESATSALVIGGKWGVFLLNKARKVPKVRPGLDASEGGRRGRGVKWFEVREADKMD